MENNHNPKVQPMSIDDSALSPTRREVIKPLEGIRQFVKRSDSGIPTSRAKEFEIGIDKLERSVRYDRYRVTVFGAFSAGKSTLLNAFIGADYLPSEDRPTTNVTTEIFKSDRYYFFIPTADIKISHLDNLQLDVAKELPGGTFMKKLERDGLEMDGVGVYFSPDDSKGFQHAVEQLASEQNRFEEGLAGFKKLIKNGHGLVLQLGIPTLPDWLGEITLTDAPGAGSVYKGHETIIDEIIPQTQLVLYVVEATKAGSAVDEYLCDKIMNNFHRKVFFVLNKIDQQNEDEINDALAELKEHVPAVKVGGAGEARPPKPEYLLASALCETMANRLASGEASLDDLVHTRKLSISELLVSDEWAKATDTDAKVEASIRFLRKNSRFDYLGKRIKSYLHEENKELPFCERAESMINQVGQEMVSVCMTTKMMLQKDRSVEELKQKQRDLHTKRDRYAKEARQVLQDFQASALNPKTGIMAKTRTDLVQIPNEIADALAEKLNDKEEYKRLTQHKCALLQEWLSKAVSCRFEPVAKNLSNELQKQGEHLLQRLRPILEKIDENSFANQALDLLNGHNAPDSAELISTIPSASVTPGALTGTAFLTGGALAAVLGLTVGSTTTIAGTGLAGLTGWSWLASIGLGTLAKTTAPFWGLGLGPAIAIVGLAAVALALIAIPTGTLLRKMISKKIVKAVRSKLTEQLIGDESSSIAKKLEKKVEKIVNESEYSCRENLDHYLESLERQEKAMIDAIDKAKDEKEKKVATLSKFEEEIRSFVESAKQTLRELNPGKDPIHD